ncbi:MAG: co-chaperone GroES [Candidatus Kerfeldbacteria bacterium RIFCSPHIGHO2_02_FULL_42_14]|uniref:Co-chaperonin GroES n=1 Tax=Candidatus Kerfeldbacteria bacterium RIFCSPHIGHO2_02_FULL_42_14 TaxID=1798540 RepID=A0A1G2ANQ9_9BACT|nr:MAG: co-chaperone GroES [Candidatus Kerfeldbacteria bacterium RIFCSPHIGHO2_02_FULL_42_14]OGY81191.1 MAG: co-chaperone GroES [Candidatus Kerfeldbacteria bacterium RIFCSPHIGHO2_12_FULL_42_13]OGY83389.1 MAG: co-chaperone GroES [Candidatus Kerfeldbacteria bacterium RIFCSPLOWO2_02_FULL_42_19]OGY85488.1 MAG: co-chaperone GroES [Candidatus Kerfeldbacteria bacterium RIFCSPLOWO2_12_FULL_43_9]
MQLQPLGDRVILKPIKKEEMTKSGIFLPDTVEKKPEEAEVIAVGPGKLLENGQRAQMEVKKGQKVIFAKYGPTEVKINDEEYMIANESDILAIIEA